MAQRMEALGEPDEGGGWAMRSKLVGLQTKGLFAGRQFTLLWEMSQS